jgi:hypothetical protein
MSSTIVNFLFRITFFSGVVFGLHILVLDYLELPLFDNRIILAYAVNVILAIIIFQFLYIFREKFKNRIGFLFVFGSMLKFALFFILFNSLYRADGIIERPEFFAFFTPYALTLVIEVFSLSKWLNKLQ